ncbi:ROK family protein [Candidatus Bipolaricaulota bacterium]|nr:ROK family protein [Candidatus Bipolaricaulota bacterium]
MNGEYVIGVDIGATWLRVGLSDVSGNILRKEKREIRTNHSYEVSEQIIEIVDYLFEETGLEIADLRGIGVASAGPMNVNKGELVNPTNIPLEVVPLSEPLGQRFGVDVELINDGASAVLAEQKFGEGQGYDNLVYITISTGIGGGAIVDGNLLYGKNGNAAEVGHFTIDQAGELTCGCGRPGHWEAYCSGSNIPGFVRMHLVALTAYEGDSQLVKLNGEELEEFEAKDLFDLARAGDELAEELVDELGRLNAIGFAAVTEAYDPALITVGGAVALHNPGMVLDPIRAKIHHYTQNEIPLIKITQLEEEVVLYGAIARALAI